VFLLHLFPLSQACRTQEQPSSAAAAALGDKKLRQTNIAAAVGCSDWFGEATKNPHNS
jgi:hypothetical protein